MYLGWHACIQLHTISPPPHAHTQPPAPHLALTVPAYRTMYVPVVKATLSLLATPPSIVFARSTLVGRVRGVVYWQGRTIARTVLLLLAGIATLCCVSCLVRDYGLEIAICHH